MAALEAIILDFDTTLAATMVATILLIIPKIRVIPFLKILIIKVATIRAIKWYSSFFSFPEKCGKEHKSKYCDGGEFVCFNYGGT